MQHRYSRYTGGPDPLAPPVDLSAALAEIAGEIMAGYSAEQALREYLRRSGLDELARRAAEQRRELLRRNNLGGTLREVRRLLDSALRSERAQLARDIDLDDTDRSFRELTLDNLPASTPAAVAELNSYDWQSTDARSDFDSIRDLLGRELLDQQFAGMKQALEGATDQDRAEIAEMLRELNALLRGEGSFEEFMARHGHHFPENPRTLAELIDALAARSAAAQRMLNSMSAQQRQELMELSALAFGSPELQELLGQLAGALHELRPGLDWGGSGDFSGDQGLGLGDGTGAMQDLAELDELAEQFSHNHTDLDLDAVRRQLGESAAVSAEQLARLDRALRDSGLLRRRPDGSLRLTPQALRRLGRALLDDASLRELRAGTGGGEPTGASRPYEFGDTQSWDIPRTITNALRRSEFRIQPEDIEVVETEQRRRTAVALLVDTSFSMAAEGRWVPMKRTALALHQLIATRFRGDELALITFGRHALAMDIEELTALPPVREQGTNLHHGLLLAERFFARHPSLDATLLIVTDGEPTAHLTNRGEAEFRWPSTPETLRRTVTQLDRVTRRGTRSTFFRLGGDPGLEIFLNQLADRVGGRVIAPDPEELSSAVLGAYLRGRAQGNH